MKQIIIFCLLLTSVAVRGQYNPSTATVTNKPLGIAQAVPTDARSYYYDASLFIWRPYQSIAEVLTFLNLTKYRIGQFSIFVNEGGALQSNGSFVGGVIKEYWFKDGTANSNLVIKTVTQYSDSAARAANSSLIEAKQDTLSGTGILKVTGSTHQYIADNSANWNTAFGWGNYKVYGLGQVNSLTDFNSATGFTFNNNVSPAASNIPLAGYHSVITLGNNTAMTSVGGQIALRYGSSGGSNIQADLYLRAKSGTSTWFPWVKVWNDATWSSSIPTDDYFDDGGTAKTTTVNRINNTLYGFVDPYTNEPVTYTKITTSPNNETITNSWVDGVMIRKKGSEYFLRNFSGGVNVKWFGAVGDVYVYDQALDANFGRVLKRNGTDATVNNAAFKKAVDFIHNYSAFLFNRFGVTAFGYHANKFKLIIPTGSYLLTEPEIFSKSRVLFTGYSEVGLHIEGEGKLASQIVFRNDGDTTKFLIENSNTWQSLYVKDIAIKCVTGKERIYHESSTGTAGMTTFNNVAFYNYFKNIVVDGASLNADRMLVERCMANSTVPGHHFFLQNSNTQAVKQSFIECSIGSTDGTMFENNASGDHLVSGCSLNAYGTSTIFRINPPGNELGEQVIIGFTCYTNKIELHDQTVYADLKGGYVHVYSEVLAMDYSTAPYFVIARNRLAGIRFDKCVIKKFPIALINTSAGSPSTFDDRPFAELMNCTLVQNNWMDNNISYFSDAAMTLPMDGTDSNAANIGRVRVYNSITKTGGLLVNSFNDGSPFSWLGNNTRTAETVRAIVRDTKYPFRGLPTPSISDTFNVPLNTMLLKISISKTGNAAAGAPSVLKWYVKDFDGVTYATLTTSTANDIIVANSGDLYRPLKTNNSRKFILSADAANGSFYGQGFVVIEYQ